MAILKATSGCRIPSIDYKKQAKKRILGLETVLSLQLLSFKKHYISKTHKIIGRFELIPTQKMCILPDVQLEAIMTTVPTQTKVNETDDISALDNSTDPIQTKKFKENDISCTPFVAPQQKKHTSPKTKNNSQSLRKYFRYCARSVK